MILPSQIKLKDSQVRVHLVGPGFGESVLIVVGSKIIIGLDCCQSLIQEKSHNASYLERQVKAAGDESYLFWMLTHFHLDHFECFETVLDMFEDRLKSIVVPTGYTIGDFDTDRLYYETMMSTRGEIPGILPASIAVDQFEVIQQALARKSFRFVVSDSSSKQVWINTQLVLPGKRRIPLVVEYYGATYEDLRKLKGQATSKLVKAERDGSLFPNDKPKKKGARSTANHGSYILHIRAGKFEGLFPGDAQTKRTEEVLRNRGATDAEVFCLKVAHHGAKDGTSQDLLDQFCQGRAAKNRRHALIAPFRSNKLPTQRVKDLLVKNSFALHMSGNNHASEVTSKITAERDPIMGGIVENDIGFGDDIITIDFEM